MIDALLEGLESMSLARILRGSVWAYPLVNAGHIFGVTLLVGGIVPLDLRLLGAWPSVPLAPLWRVMTRTAGAGLAVAMICGGLLFITRATAYAESSLFLCKMVAVGAGVINALALHLTVAKNGLPVRGSAANPRGGVRFAAGISLATWLAALTLGRLIGYF